MGDRVICYVLLTYGTKPNGSIATHPAAQSQLRFYKKIVSDNDIRRTQVVYDYSRKIKGLGCLPRLREILEKLKNNKAGKVYIDDVARLLKACKLPFRVAFLEELRGYGAQLFSLKHRKSLDEFSGEMFTAIVRDPEKFKLPGQQMRSKETQAARLSSTEVRSKNALRHAQPLMDLRRELVASSARATLKDIADEAATRGLRTSKGKPWTPQNVARALKLVDRHENDVD